MKTTGAVLLLHSALCLFILPTFSLGGDLSPEVHRHHVGLGLGPVYNVAEMRWLAGLGAEYEYVLPFTGGLFGVGFMAEMVFDKHRHYVLGLKVPVHPMGSWTFSISPGIMWIRGEDPPRRFALHLGVEHEFELGGVSVAPSFEAAFAGADVHLSLGLHLGFGF